MQNLWRPNQCLDCVSTTNRVLALLVLCYLNKEGRLKDFFWQEYSVYRSFLWSRDLNLLCLLKVTFRSWNGVKDGKNQVLWNHFRLVYKTDVADNLVFLYLR